MFISLNDEHPTATGKKRHQTAFDCSRKQTGRKKTVFFSLNPTKVESKCAANIICASTIRLFVYPFALTSPHPVLQGCSAKGGRGAENPPPDFCAYYVNFTACA